MPLITVARLQSHGEKESRSPFPHFFLSCLPCQGSLPYLSHRSARSLQLLGMWSRWVRGWSRVFVQDKLGILEDRNVGGKSKVQLGKRLELFYMASAHPLSALNHLVPHVHSFCMRSLHLLCYLRKEALKVD